MLHWMLSRSCLWTGEALQVVLTAVRGPLMTPLLAAPDAPQFQALPAMVA